MKTYALCSLSYHFDIICKEQRQCFEVRGSLTHAEMGLMQRRTGTVYRKGLINFFTLFFSGVVAMVIKTPKMPPSPHLPDGTKPLKWKCKETFPPRQLLKRMVRGDPSVSPEDPTRTPLPPINPPQPLPVHIWCV